MATNYVVRDPQHVQDENGDIIGYLKDQGSTLVYTPRYATDPLTGVVTGLVGPTGDFLVVSSTAPSDADGRPNGTIYIQTV